MWIPFHKVVKIYYLKLTIFRDHLQRLERRPQHLQVREEPTREFIDNAFTDHEMDFRQGKITFRD